MPGSADAPAAIPSALRPFAENAFRLLEVEVDTSWLEASKVANKLASRIAAGKDDPSGMLPLGPRRRTAEQVRTAASELAEPSRAAVHALFFPWVAALPVDPQALPRELLALTEELRSRVTPFELVRPLASRVLPASQDGEAEPRHLEVGGYLFPGDLDLDEAVGPPRRPEAGAPASESGGFLSALERAPSAISDALLGVARLGAGRKLHAAYLRSLLAAADAGEASAWRRLPTAAALFQEVTSEPSASLILAWREFVEGRADTAGEALAKAESDARLNLAEQMRARVLRLRLQAAADPGDTLELLKPLDGVEASAVRGALLLEQGEDERSEPELERAWTEPELRPRIASLRALIQIERGHLEAANAALAFAPEGRNTSLARARLAHAESRVHEAVELYREVLDEEDDDAPLGAWWGLAMLSEDAEERAVARSWLEEATAGSELAATLAREALEDGELDEAEAWLGRLPDDDQARTVRALILDRLGRRAEAWALRGVKEEVVRDRARAALDGGRPEEALDELAGLAIADPLRRRAARAVVLRGLSGAPDADADEVVRRLLGRLSPEETALLDLPAHLFRAVREIESGDSAAAVASLRRHLDGGDHPLAARLFDVLTAAPEEGRARLTTFLTGAAQASTVEAILQAGRVIDPAAWDCAVVLAALDGVATDPGPSLNAPPEACLAAGILKARHALRSGDWKRCEDALAEIAATRSPSWSTVASALAAVRRARFAEARRADPVAALRALEAESAPSKEVLHDRAVLRHAVLAAAPDHTQLAALAQAWDSAQQAGALSHPAHPAEPKVLEGEVVAELVRLLGAVQPADASAVRQAIEASGSQLGLAALERGGWLHRP